MIRSSAARAAALVCFCAGLPAVASPRNAAVQVSAGDGVTDAEAEQVEARLWKALAPALEKKGFALEPLGPMNDYLRAQGVPPGEFHQSSNSPANTARIVRMRELDVELVWMTVLSRDGELTRLAYSAMAFHDLSNLGNGLQQAKSLDALEAVLDREGPAMVEAALAKLKPVPMPAWWRPMAPPQLAAPPPQAIAAPPPPRAGMRLADGAQIAVLELKRGKGFSLDDARYLSDVIRAAVLKLVPRLSVMTRENLIVLLQASGKSLDECEGECEVDTARRIGADALISGDALKFGARFKLSLRLHETKGGHLLAAAVASGATLEELDSDLQLRAAELLENQK